MLYKVPGFKKDLFLYLYTLNVPPLCIFLERLKNLAQTEIFLMFINEKVRNYYISSLYKRYFSDYYLTNRNICYDRTKEISYGTLGS